MTQTLRDICMKKLSSWEQIALPLPPGIVRTLKPQIHHFCQVKDAKLNQRFDKK